MIPNRRFFSPTIAPTRWSLLVFIAALGLVLQSGCKEKGTTVTIPEARSVTQPTGRADDFEKAFTLIDRLDEFDPEQVMTQAAYHLTRWLTSQPPAEDWTRDALINDSLGGLENLLSLRNANSRNVSRGDIRYVHEATWLRDISVWASEAQELPITAELREKTGQDLPANEAQQLARAMRLFDWTIRNIQLIPAAKPSAEPSPLASSGERGERAPPAALGIPGQGYTLQPWEILLFGQGDAWHRARIYILLTRQAGIDSFVLALPPTDLQSAPQPWAVGTVIGEQIFLFDTRLGLPIPSTDWQGIATLGELRAAPDLLERLDVGETLRYPIRPDQIGEMYALLDASSESLSFRMHAIQDRLTGSRRMTLTSEPSRIAGRLAEFEGIANIRLWSVPLEAELFQAAWEEIRRNDSRANAVYEQRMAIFSQLSPLLAARQLYFRRQFERVEEKPGAVMKYMEARVPEREIDAILTSDTVRSKLGLGRTRVESEEAWLARLQISQDLIRQGKDHASYWLGIVHLENSDYENAISWFGRRTLESSPESMWTDGARYNLARALEAQGKYDQARESYLLDRSPQRHGNLLRARYLRLHKMSPDSATTPENPTSEIDQAVDR